MRAEVPNVRLIAEQDFPFKAGVDVTDVRQVKGLEFDYVVLVDVTAQQLSGRRRSAPSAAHRRPRARRTSCGS